MHNASSIARLAALAGALAIAGIPTVVRADPAGTYAVEGTNPGSGGRYKGTVSVEQTGETYRVIWIINNRQYIGDGAGYTGVWTYAAGTKMGAERWQRQ